MTMDDNTHFIIERDGEYLEHYGIKGMKWKKRSAGKNVSKPSNLDKEKKPKKDPYEITVKETVLREKPLRETFLTENPPKSKIKNDIEKPNKKKKSKAKSYVSSKVKDASIAYESGKARLKKLFGG